MSVAIAKKGKILYTQGYGYADLSTCQAVQPATEFQIGSVTKQFTAAALLRLWNAGALNVDAPVVGYLGSYGFDPRITLRMLLTRLPACRLSWFPGGKLVAQWWIGANRSQPDRTGPAALRAWDCIRLQQQQLLCPGIGH